MSTVFKYWTGLLLLTVSVVVLQLLVYPNLSWARNITQYKDTISNSTPSVGSNHTLTFKLDTALSNGGIIEISLPDGFEVSATTTFAAERNVELSVGGLLRDSDRVIAPGVDGVEIVPGTPGLIRYTLNPSTGIPIGSYLEFKIGNHTTKTQFFSETYATSTGTTTTYADIKPIINGATPGTHKVVIKVFDGVEIADASFSIALVEQVGIGPIDTTEKIPPYRFNGSPTTTVTGASLRVEIFVETNELAICKYAREPDVGYGIMPFTFINTGRIYHTDVVAVSPDSIQKFYIRCLDDEGNFNIDDYLLEFPVSSMPTGSSTNDGGVEGDGTGTGNTGTGTGSGAGGTSGGGGGGAATSGGASGSGGSGGGGGGGNGGTSGSTAGGGFESTDAPYRSGDGRVTIDGFTSPKSDVVILVDGKETQKVRSNAEGLYSVVLNEIARGVYTFGVYTLDPDQTRSSAFSTSFTVTGARTSALSNITIPPTIKAYPNPINPGETLTLSGYSLPNASIAIENEKDKSVASRQQLTAMTDGNGRWSILVDTKNFSVGTYKARAKAVQGTVQSTSFSAYTLYGVGQAAVKLINADLNRDGKVNLVDFSILLFWWSGNGGTSDPSADINGDSKVNLVDFSILLFNWTG